MRLLFADARWHTGQGELAALTAVLLAGLAAHVYHC